MKPRNFFAEFKRRNVYKVAIACVVASWALARGIARSSTRPGIRCATIRASRNSHGQRDGAGRRDETMNLFEELKRRVFKVGAACLAVAWLVGAGGLDRISGVR